MSFCRRCGKGISQDFAFCMHCGTPVTVPSTTSSVLTTSYNLRNIVIVALMVFLIFAAAATGAYYVTRPAIHTESRPTSIEATTFSRAPKYVTFPYSWVESGNGIDIKISVLNVTCWGTEYADEGYQLYAVFVAFENLGHEHFNSLGSGVGTLLELQTNRTNVYMAESVRCGDLKPEEVYVTSVRFELRVDEKPVELRDYEPTGDDYDLYVAYIWKIEYVTERQESLLWRLAYLAI